MRGPTFLSVLVVILLLWAQLLLDLSSSGAAAAAQHRSHDCINPASKYGHCIELIDCPHLLAILQQVPINRESVKFLQRSTCGFSNNNPDAPKVCCVTAAPAAVEPPQSGSADKGHSSSSMERPSSPGGSGSGGQSPQVQQPKETTTTSERTTILSLALVPTKDKENELQRHSNLRLLPSERMCGLSSALDRIVGGEDSGLGTYPWMALLGVTDPSDGEVQYHCGGTLISKRYVLTAAHCVVKLPFGFKLSVVRLGEYDQTKETDCSDDGICAPPAQDIAVEEIIPHEKYDLTHRKENDIALLRLSKDASFDSFVLPVCLPLKSPTADQLSSPTIEVNRDGLLVAGWGRTMSNKEDGSAILQHVRVPLVSNSACNAFFKSRLRNEEIGEGRFCAGGEANKDSCKGDSGGPVMASLTINRRQQRTYQFGIVSLGPPTCAGENEPALYTRISYYLTWILDNLKP